MKLNAAQSDCLIERTQPQMHCSDSSSESETNDVDIYNHGPPVYSIQTTSREGFPVRQNLQA